MAQDKIASIFKRGGQKAEYGASSAEGEGGGLDGADAEQQLEQHLAQLAVAWAAPKLKRGLAAAVWRPAVGAFEVIERGRQAFNGQGFTHNKKLYLNIEEAVYLLDRATTLLLIESEVQQQQQAQQQQQQQQQQVQPVMQQRLLSVQEALHMMAVLGVQHERLCVLSYLSRLGFTVRRHPACWQVPAHVPACRTWQVNPAWAHTDGLTPPSAAQAHAAVAATKAAATAAPAAAAATATAAAAVLPQNQQVSNGSQQQQQQQQQQASSPTAEQATKRRKVQDAASEQQQQQQQGASAAEAQPELPSSRQWYGGLPAWLHPQQQQQQQQQHGDVQGQQVGEVEVVAPLLGLQLKQQFPLLRPLQRYGDTAAGAVSFQQQQQQQPDTPGVQRECCAATMPRGGGRVADVVFDVLVKHDASKFSYRQPPAPQFSIAMMHPGCNNLPRLDEVLNLSRIAAAAAAVPAAAAEALPAAAPVSLAAAAAAGGAAAQAEAVVSGSISSSRVSYRAVKFGLPEEGDVGFCELVPLRLMDLLTNM